MQLVLAGEAKEIAVKAIKARGYDNPILVPGHDGNPPVERKPRDLGGRGKREVEGGLNINTDRLEWLHHHGKIEQYQLEAGRRLAKDWEDMQIGGYAMSDGAAGKRDWLAGFSPSDLKCEAGRRYSNAKKALGRKIWLVLEMVVLNNWEPPRAAKAMGWDERGGIAGIDLALESLARVYGMV